MAAMMKAHRLSVLLRNFGLVPKDLVQKEPKAVIPLLRQEYYRRAKEQHPDLVPEEQRGVASDRFKRLSHEFEEAHKLLEAGIRPVEASLPPGVDSKTRFVYKERHWQDAEPRTYGDDPWKQPTFDLRTRVKGHLIFWSGMFCFLSFMREFLVWSAGHGFAWSMPKSANIFWVRRFKDEWNDTANEVQRKPSVGGAEPQQQQQQEEAPKYTPKKRERGIDNFYQKRGISNIRKKTEPRGWENRA